MSPSRALRSVRLVPVIAGAVLIGGFGTATPAAARVSVDQPATTTVVAMSSGRVGASTAALLGLLGIVIGALALARPASRLGIGNGRSGATLALVAGLAAMALGGLVLATADGGVGTGNGLGGAYVALVVGLISIVLGGLALTRSRRAG